jgi:serine/threonine-protein kinase RsbW
MKRETWLPATPASAALARAMVRAAGRDLDCGEVPLSELVLATSEAVANAVEHGGSCGTRNEIQVRIEQSAGELWVEVCDCGRFSAPVGPPDPCSQRGRGLPIIAAMVDRFEIMPGQERTRVRLGKRLATA